MTDLINEYRFGYSREELERPGTRYFIWSEDNRGESGVRVASLPRQRTQTDLCHYG
jgi:hypothetical protein